MPRQVGRGRIRGRDVESGSVSHRVLRSNAVRRGELGARSVGRDEIQTGAVSHRHIGPQAVREANLDPSLIPRETFSFEPDQVAVVACESADYPVHRGGRPRVTATVRGAPTGDLVATLYRNGVSFGTLTIPDGELVAVASYNAPFSPGDLARSEVTDPAADATWLVIAWVLR